MAYPSNASYSLYFRLYNKTDVFLNLLNPDFPSGQPDTVSNDVSGFKDGSGQSDVEFDFRFGFSSVNRRYGAAGARQ